jgi:hypothetical protein
MCCKMCEIGLEWSVMKGTFLLEKYLLRCFSSGVGGISAKLDIWNCSHMRCNCCKCVCNRTLMKVDLLGERRTFSCVSRLTSEWLSLKFALFNQNTCAAKKIWLRSVKSEVHFTWRALYRFAYISASSRGIFLKLNMFGWFRLMWVGLGYFGLGLVRILYFWLGKFSLF